MDKKAARLRRGLRTRMKIRELGIHRLCIHRTPRHIYAQVITPDGGHVVAAASTLEKLVKEGLTSTGNVDAARAVGKTIAGKALEAGITHVAFDRSGFRYHGRIKALADAAREQGLQF
ncbi:MAG: 50S ribosomal protein L18 [Gammaproteobacteria bacterium]|nr:50S ribosomal protein L18 [Gammaproteobacteria bacterium]MCP5423799.1 50S ribosomal protein L18 [Gammaproteobacteria bacterium]